MKVVGISDEIEVDGKVEDGVIVARELIMKICS